MKGLQELVNNGKLSETLLSNKKFVKEAKEILRSENIEADDKNLAQLMDEIASKLKADSTRKVDDEELANVAGGVTARGAVVTVSSVIGAVVGALVGRVAEDASNKGSSFELSRMEPLYNVNQPYLGPKGEIDITPKPGFTPGEKSVSVNYAGVAATTLGAGGGAYAGHKIGHLICDYFKIS